MVGGTVMARGTLHALLYHLRRTDDGPGRESDGELLARFCARRDEAAFAALVRRHGGLVLSACRRALADPADVEDAFQATFVVLLRKADSIRRLPSVGPWLYHVAFRVALQARAGADRRRRREQRAAERASPAAPGPDLSWREACAVLHAELDRLPEKFRLPLLLCYLEGKSRDEAAQQLGWTAGALKGRLERGRLALRDRLARRGLTLATGLLVGGAASPAWALPPALVRSATRLASLYATPAGPSGATGQAPLLLAQGVLHAMRTTRLKLTAAGLLLLGLLGTGLALHARPGAPPAGATATAWASGAAAAARPAAPAAEKAKPAPAAEVAGRVLGPDGKPAAGARVYVLSSDRDPKDKSSPRATADADGRFRFPLGPRPDTEYGPARRTVVAVADGLAADWFDPDETKGDHTLRLVKDLPIQGRVLDLQGRPVKGVTVRPQRLETTAGENLDAVLEVFTAHAGRGEAAASKRLYLTEIPGLPAAATTGADGRFRIAGVGRERMAVLRVEGDAVEHETVRVAAREGLDVKKLPKDGGPEMIGMPRGPQARLYGPTFDHVARPGRPVVGTVTDAATGKPLAGVHVNGSAAGSWWENHVTTTTDDRGRYRLSGLAKAPRYRVTFSAGEGRPYLPAETSAGDADGLAPVTADFALARGVWLTGRVTDKATGRPVPGHLTYEPLADNKFFTKTPGTDLFRSSVTSHQVRKDGSFKLVALPGAALVHVRADLPGSPNRYARARLDPADRPRIYREDAGMGISFLTAGGRIESVMFSNAYKLIDPPADAESFAVDFRLDPGLRQTGKVVGPDGKPLAGALFAGARAVDEGVVTLPGDAFEADALDPAAPRVLTFYHPGQKLAGSLALGGAEKDPVTVKLQPCGTLTGRLIGEDGKPLAGLAVTTFYADRTAFVLSETVRPTTLRPGKDAPRTDAEGRFTLDRLFPSQKVSVGFRTDRRFYQTKPELRDATVTAGEQRDLGALVGTPFGPGE